MFSSIFQQEIPRSEEILIPQPLNTLLPRLYPKKESPKKDSTNNIYSKEKFISKKRKKSKEKSKHKINTFNSQNNFKYNNYFIGELKENIINLKRLKYNNSSKCYICGKSGHHCVECKEKKEEICPKCLQKTHLDNVCPYEICLNCGKRGHKTQDCFYTKKNKNRKHLIKCYNCLNFGHENYECLCKPNPIYIKNYSKMPLCSFCGSSSHYICPFSKNEDLFVVPEHYDDKKYNTDNYKAKKEVINRNSFESLMNFFLKESKKNEKLELNLGELAEDITKEDIKITNFCCKCGKNHFSEDCEKIKSKKKYLENSNEDFIFNLKDNIIHNKNPLKYEPYLRKEYKINHHDIREDYYDQSDSSGESFNKIFKKDN